MRKWIRHVAIALLCGILLLVSLYGLYELALGTRFSPAPPKADFPPPLDEIDARRQDLTYFRHYLELDKSYTDKTRKQAQQILAGLEQELEALSAAEFQLEIARAVAQADNGHSNIWLGRFSRQHGRIPLRLYWFTDGLYVMRAHADSADLLGAQLIAVEDANLEYAANRLRRYVGGTWEAFRAYRGPVLFELPAAHFAAKLSNSERTTRYTFRLADGSVVQRTLSAETLAADEPLSWPTSYLYPMSGKSAGEQWRGISRASAPTPLYLQSPAISYQLQALPNNGMYIQYRNNRGEGMDSFEDSVRAALQSAPPAYLVVDQRFNGGGDYTLTSSLMRDLPGMVANSGKVYAITGPATFSAGINSVAFLKAAGQQQVVIVGERIGDRERIYGETNDFELPNSKLGMTFNTGLHDVANGCPPWPQCYWRNYFNDVAVGRLDPDLAVATTFAHYATGVDPVLEAILALETRDQQ